MKRRSLGAGLACAIALSGCADSHQLIARGQEAGFVLSASDPIYVSVSRDGIYGHKTYNGSALMTTQILFSSIAKRAQRVEMARAHQSLDEALKVARTGGYRFLVYPQILHWEDRATEWSMIPDRVEVRVDIVDTSSGKTLDSVVVQGTSGIATIGGDHPQDLLPRPVEEYMSRLFRETR